MKMRRRKNIFFYNEKRILNSKNIFARNKSELDKLNSDRNNKLRYFEVDHEQKWSLSDIDSGKRDICYICEKQKYMMCYHLYEIQLNFSNKISNP